MKKSNSIANLAAALSKAQAEMPRVLMNAQNPFLKNRYADLGAVIETSRPVLAKHGLSVSQFPTSSLKEIGVTSILMHASGEFLEETITVPLEIGKGLSINQATGVSITYLRRYAWASILGLYADEDVDGEVREVNQKVEKIMKEERVWSLEAMEAVIEVGGIASNHEEALLVLNHSIMPDDVPVKTIESWLRHFANSGANSTLAAADVANTAYIKAKGGKK